jgi:hypothetical protein
MRTELSARGFGFVIHPTYTNEPKETRLVSESSAIGDYEDSMGSPGSSYLWVGVDHHLDREEVEELIGYMQGWLDTGCLIPPERESE